MPRPTDRQLYILKACVKRDQVFRFNSQLSDRLESLDLKSTKAVDAIATQLNVVEAVHDTQFTAELERCLPNTTQAAFNSFENRHEPLCLENTCVDILKEIRTWADGQDERCIFWLNGLAGTGKSTIARTIAREYFETKRLGASFFFSRGGGDAGHAGKFFTSIALQLADKSPSLRRYICEAIAENSNIANQALCDQWRHLILQPLSKLDSNFSHHSLLIVVDALDECEGEDDIREIVQLFAEARSLSTVRLRVFMTSRPEVAIRHGFSEIPDAEHQDFILHNISPSIIDHDISTFLQHRLKIIRQERRQATDWPGDDAIRSLVQKASGLFIWAATACRIISEGRYLAAERLSDLLEGNSSLEPEKHLNEIYLGVLRNAVGHDYEEKERECLCEILRAILGTIAILFSPLPIFSLAKLLRMSQEDVEKSLDDLHSVLDISNDQTRPIRLHHPSFRDFLLDNDRCVDAHFWVDEKETHESLANSCIKLMSNNLRSLGPLTRDIHENQMEQCLPAELQYACLYWVQHLRKSGTPLHDDGQVHLFLQKHLLHWLECLCLMRKIDEAVLAIISLNSIVAVSGIESTSCKGI